MTSRPTTEIIADLIYTAHPFDYRPLMDEAARRLQELHLAYSPEAREVIEAARVWRWHQGKYSHLLVGPSRRLMEAVRELDMTDPGAIERQPAAPAAQTPRGTQ